METSWTWSRNGRSGYVSIAGDDGVVCEFVGGGRARLVARLRRKAGHSAGLLVVAARGLVSGL